MAGFHWLDYVVFSASILISIGVGIYHAIAKGGQNTTDKYLLGDRKMHFLPVTISLVSIQIKYELCSLCSILIKITVSD